MGNKRKTVKKGVAKAKSKVLEVDNAAKIAEMDKILNSKSITVVLVHSPMCGPCRRFREEKWDPMTKMSARNNRIAIRNDLFDGTNLSKNVTGVDYLPSIILVENGVPQLMNGPEGPTNVIPTPKTLEDLVNVVNVRPADAAIKPNNAAPANSMANLKNFNATPKNSMANLKNFNATPKNSMANLKNFNATPKNASANLNNKPFNTSPDNNSAREEYSVEPMLSQEPMLQEEPMLSQEPMLQEDSLTALPPNARKSPLTKSQIHYPTNQVSPTMLKGGGRILALMRSYNRKTRRNRKN